MGQIPRQLCEWKGINILEAEVCVDHIHVLIEILLWISEEQELANDFLKGKIQVSKQILLVQRILCRYGRKENDEYTRVYKKPAG